MADGLFGALKKKSNELPPEWQKVLAPGSALYETAVLLNATGRLPKLVYGETSSPSNIGEYNSDENTVTLNKRISGLYPEVLTHEVTHALTYTMQKATRDIQAKVEKTGQPANAVDRQFYDAWQKLDPDLLNSPKYIYPDKDYQNYRFSFMEAPAFAVSNMERPEKSMTRRQYTQTMPGGLHYDATLATEQAILRDLYARKLNPQTPPTATPWWKDPFGFTIK